VVESRWEHAELADSELKPAAARYGGLRFDCTNKLKRVASIN
jgi:hypothetical protein